MILSWVYWEGLTASSPSPLSYFPGLGRLRLDILPLEENASLLPPGLCISLISHSSTYYCYFGKGRKEAFLPLEFGQRQAGKILTDSILVKLYWAGAWHDRKAGGSLSISTSRRQAGGAVSHVTAAGRTASGHLRGGRAHIPSLDILPDIQLTVGWQARRKAGADRQGRKDWGRRAGLGGGRHSRQAGGQASLSVSLLSSLSVSPSLLGGQPQWAGRQTWHAFHHYLPH